MTETWQQHLWRELDEKDPVERVKAISVWIADITRTVLPELGLRRRKEILALVSQEGWDARRLAEEIGSRTTTITRLVEEGRAAQRGQREEALAPSPPPM